MKKTIAFLSLSLLLAACGVDTTGIASESAKPPRGNPAARVVITEYGDFECPACRVAHTLITQPLMQKYGSQVRLDFKQFPLLTLHPLAMSLAEASECAADQGKFWEFVDTVYDRQLALDREQKEMTAADIEPWAAGLGLDMELFGRCTSSHIKRQAIMAEFDAGRQAGIAGTPTFLVEGKKVNNDLAELSAAVEEALKNAAPRAL
ncbi:MAG: thioredoxin domain-containing protein [Candidatus Peribacteraceae bacterium]|nr:thioredoxin domain-containing protein [Candidatus Peribacteraceae bacterium]